MPLIGSKRLKTNRVLLLLLLVTCSCARVSPTIEPQIGTLIEPRYLASLPSPFSPLSSRERETDWGREYTIGLRFAKRLDLYRAITAFERAEILLPEEDSSRRQEMTYNILLSYYLGQKYSEVITTYENSNLRFATQEFPAFHDLLVILYDCYREVESPQAGRILQLICHTYPETYQKLVLSVALKIGDFPTLESLDSPVATRALECYNAEKKSVGGAGALNAILPGAGYLYIGEKQTAVTAFLFNALFITAAVYFYKNGNIAAGAITTGFEAGWYFGGINGAARQARYYNDRLYERCAGPEMRREGLFPVYQLRYSF